MRKFLVFVFAVALYSGMTTAVHAQDGILVVSIDSEFTVTESDNAYVDLRVMLDEPSSELVAVSYGTVAGTADAGSDYYDMPTNMLIFYPGETLKYVRVTLIDDAEQEADEHFSVKLQSVLAGSLVIDAGVHTTDITIVDNDTVVSAQQAPTNKEALKTEIQALVVLRDHLKEEITNLRADGASKKEIKAVKAELEIVKAQIHALRQEKQALR